ncbi:nuclear transport factor 2 family protein [Aquimarina brevivitae]|uniref:SnoaL-like protein n=1 Tax=Aquimarina brevivitae TaxID=323412 RepID=A0A4Q7P1I4_9FLAO|nr:nuclear transport factor 2 family protein [Aquimarina brevivitae]RZS93574.1 SnoaL-like protein [Aquimarina brevivitae]
MHKVIYCILFLAIPLASFAQTKKTTNTAIALAYMKAYGDWDFDSMKIFYSDAIHFEDPTAKEAFKQPFVFDGKESVYTFFKDVFKDQFENDKPPYVDFKISKTFSSGSHTVVNSTFECVLPAAWFKENSEETILISIPFTTILTIENGLITKHIDYGDYTTYFEQINAQINN